MQNNSNSTLIVPQMFIILYVSQIYLNFFNCPINFLTFWKQRTQKYQISLTVSYKFAADNLVMYEPSHEKTNIMASAQCIDPDHPAQSMHA